MDVVSKSAGINWGAAGSHSARSSPCRAVGSRGPGAVWILWIWKFEEPVNCHRHRFCMILQL